MIYYMKRKTLLIHTYTASHILLAVMALAILFLASCTSNPSAPVEQAPEAVSERMETPTEPEMTTEQILQNLYTDLAAGNYGKALTAFELLDPETAQDPEIRMLKTSVLISAGNTDEAREQLQNILGQNDNNPEALYVLSTLEAADGNEAEQKRLLETLIKLDEDHAPALASLGHIAYRNKIYRLAEDYYNRSLAADPDHAEALIGKARIRRYFRDPKNAEAFLNKAIRIYPQWTLPLSERARIYREEGFLREALADLDTANALDDQDYWLALEDRKSVV